MLAASVRALLKLLPDGLAFRLVVLLASISPPPPLKARDKSALAAARELRWGAAGRKRAWCWGEGPPVLLIHGWGGRATQMAPLAQHLASMGFAAWAIDVHAHGQSAGLRIGFHRFIADIAEFCAQLPQPPQALIGHSAGGMSMMAARELRGLRAARYVCINAPRFPYPPLRQLHKLLAPRAGVLARCRDYYAAQFHSDWQRLADGRIYRPLDEAQLLLINDRDDDQVAAADGELIAAQWPGAQTHCTQGLGHQQVLWSQEVMNAVSWFLTDDAAISAARAPG